MQIRGIVLIACILIAATAFAGCTGTVQQPQETPTATPTPEPTTAAPTPTPEPALYPDALAMGEFYRYGTNETGREVTVDRYMLQDSYQFYHPDWGMKKTTKLPAEGNQFLFVFLKVKHAGTAKELITPYPGSIYAVADGVSYSHRADRAESVTTVVDVRGVEDYTFQKIYKTQTIDGFLIYEIPASVTAGDIYIAMNLGNDEVAAFDLA